ncbi:hypothetical protein IPJ63_02855 [Candidatus Nomurabacteria bacterium]|nr:MAG: hypothetical protein IPJ63_02855 [Candidatus Nomurabacteria bacterium]
MENNKRISEQTFKNPGKKLKTDKGFMVNYHNFCFFVNEVFEYTHDTIWKKTFKKGVLPPTNEYGRLKNEVIGADKESFLTSEEEAKAKVIVAALEENPFLHMTLKEVWNAKEALNENENAMKLVDNAEHRARVGDYMAKSQKGHTGRW